MAAPEYDLETQSKIICAICVLNNFIHIHDPDEDLGVQDAELLQQVLRNSATDFGGSISPTERNSANARRDDIVQHM